MAVTLSFLHVNGNLCLPVSSEFAVLLPIRTVCSTPPRPLRCYIQAPNSLDVPVQNFFCGIDVNFWAVPWEVTLSGSVSRSWYVTRRRSWRSRWEHTLKLFRGSIAFKIYSEQHSWYGWYSMKWGKSFGCKTRGVHATVSIRSPILASFLTHYLLAGPWAWSWTFFQSSGRRPMRDSSRVGRARVTCWLSSRVWYCLQMPPHAQRMFFPTSRWTERRKSGCKVAAARLESLQM